MKTVQPISSGSNRFAAIAGRTGFAQDSPLEQDGFEPPVPLADLGRSGPESRNVFVTPLTSTASAGWRAALGGRGVLDNGRSTGVLPAVVTLAGSTVNLH
jgi:hypothetical protein